MPRDNQDQLGWGNHDTVVTGSQGSEQVSKIEWNDSTNQGGLFGFVKQSGTISTNAIVPSGSVIEIQLDGTLNTLTPTNNNEFDLIYLIGKSGEDAITITHNHSGGSGNIRLLGGNSITLSTTVPLILMARTIGANLEWVEYGVNTILSGTTLASTVLTSSLTTVGTIGTGTWQGTAVADGYLGTGINANKIADASVSDTEFQRLDGVTSDIQGQIDGKSATAGNGSLVTVGALDSGSITSGFGTINTGSSTITTTGALASGAITTGGTLTMGDNIITGIKSLDTDIDDLGWLAATVVDFDTNEEIILGEITGTTTFTSTNRAKGKHKVIHMDSNGSANTLTFSEAWLFYGTKPTATVADKKSILSLVCLGTAVGDVRAVFVEQAD